MCDRSRVHPIFLGYANAALHALHSRKSGQRLFFKQHLTASRALAPAFDEASGPLESAADELIVGAFRDAGSDRQSELPLEVVAHSVRVGLVVVAAGGDGFGPVVVRPLQLIQRQRGYALIAEKLGCSRFPLRECASRACPI